MFIPLHDANQLRHVQLHYVTLGLIGLNVLVFLLQLSAGDVFTFRYALVPSAFTGDAVRPDELSAVPEWATLFTYAFLHADIWHLLGNMVFLWVFGDNVEDAMGHARYLVFYLLSSAGAGLAFVAMAPGADNPLVGASGAVAGIIAAYLMLHPRVRIWVLLFARIPVRLSAMWVLGFWIVLQVWNAYAGEDQQIAWWAHIGGLAVGAVLVLFLRRPGVPLFDRAERV